MGSTSTLERHWLGLWCHGWRNSYADAHDHDWPWLAFGAQPKNRGRAGYECRTTWHDNRFCQATLDLPDVVSLGIRQRLDPRWTLLGTVEWSNWSRIGTSNILQLNGAPATILGQPAIIPFQWQDGWFFSGGAEYIWSDRLTVRGGIGYEISPVTDQVRTPHSCRTMTDSGRRLAQPGRSSKVCTLTSPIRTYGLRIQIINIVAGNPSFIAGSPPLPALPYVGNVNAHSDILSAALVFRLDDLEPTQRRPFLKYQ